PQPAHVTTAIVISNAKSVPSTPPAALPSRRWSCWSKCPCIAELCVISAGSIVASRSSCWPKPLCLDALRGIAECMQMRRRGLDQWGRAANEGQRTFVYLPGNGAQQLGINAPSVTSPALRTRTSQRVRHVQQRIRAGQPTELLAIDDVFEGPGGIEQACRDLATSHRPVPKHRRERHDTRSTGHEQQRTAQARLPDEIAPDRATQLELVPHTQLIGQVGRHLAILDALDGQRHLPLLWRRGDGVAALRLISIL